MMSYKTFRFFVKDHVGQLLLDAPPVNCIGEDLLYDLAWLLETLPRIEELRALVISSALPKVFCAGADIRQFSKWDEKEGTRMSAWGNRIFDCLAALPVPTICAINGAACGGGLELALVCDIRIAERSARFSMPESGLGILPAYGGTRRLPALIGRGRAGCLMYAGQVISGETAYDWGLCDELVADGQASQRALELAKAIASKAPLAVRGIKQCIAPTEPVWATQEMDTPSLENELFGRLCATKDKVEGVRAFQEKRIPIFSGK